VIYLTNFYNIPPSLRQRGYFCCWRYEEHGGRKTKIPFNPVTGGKAQTNNKNTFTDFDTAVLMSSGYDGIGFLITDGLFVIDCDHCFSAENILTPTTAEVVEAFNGCYMERSPSKDGLHIIGYAPGFKFDKSKYLMNNRSIGVEVYISGNTNRFMTVTGDVYHEGNIANKPAALQAFLDRYMVRTYAKKSTETPSIGTSQFDDDTILEKAKLARNGIEFQKLWGGDFSSYPSQSEADLALCGILAFWCNRDIAQIDRLFRRSGLMREKWDRVQNDSTYGLITLQKATGETKDVYHKPKKQQIATDFRKPDLSEMHPENNSRYAWTDKGSGRLFADYVRNVARYVPKRKMWFCYDGKRWVPDFEALIVRQLCIDFTDELAKYARTIEDEKRRIDYLNFVLKWERHIFRETVVKEAQVAYPIKMEEFDTDIYAFNCVNGTLHLNTIEFLSHNPEDKITKLSPVHYDPTAYFKRWEEFIVQVMSNDLEKARFLQKAFGYALSGDTRYECMFVLHGAQARNGKGTLCESVLQVMGDYGAAVMPETVAQRPNNSNKNSSSPSEDVARLAGIRFANISEPAKGLVLNSAQIKTMTGHDSINARFLHENSFDFFPQFKLYINTNHLPIVTDMTVFNSERIKVIPFERKFLPDEQDHTLKAEFKKKKVQSAILNWLVEGYKMLIDEGLTLPTSVSTATDSYSHDSDKVGRFVEEMLESDENSEIKTAIIYAAYQKWCRRNGLHAEGSATLNNALRAVARTPPAA